MDARVSQRNLHPNLPGALNRKSRPPASCWVEVSVQDTREALRARGGLSKIHRVKRGAAVLAVVSQGFENSQYGIHEKVTIMQE